VGECFNDRIARLYSKAWSVGFLRTVLAGTPTPAEPWLCTEHDVGVAVNTLEAAFEAIAAIRQRGHHRVVAKESHGLAGHNSIRLWEPEVSKTQRQWLARALQNGRQLIIEPWLERELDFSIQLEMGTRSLKVCGYTGLINDRKGQFQANFAAPNYARRILADVSALFQEPAGVVARLHDLYAEIFSLLEPELRSAGFLGPLGIDAFVYRTAQGEHRLKPIVEINPRYTMGRLTVELMKHVAPGSNGLFRLVSLATVRAASFEDFASYARSLSEKFPLRLEGEPVPRIREGVLFLNEPARAQACLAVFQASRSGYTKSQK
jgi:hypothetical protein